MTDSGELSYFYSYPSANIFDIMHSFPLFFVRFALAAGVAAGIAILDRAISYGGLMAVGAVVYVVGGRK